MAQPPISIKSILEEIERDESRSIVITIPSNKSWSEYEKELAQVADGRQVLNFKVANFPKGVKVGDRCYVVYRGLIVGWMSIAGMSEKSFRCSTTGKEWKGRFIERSGKFHYLDEKIPMKGFQGFRYFSLYRYMRDRGLTNNTNDTQNTETH